MTGRQTRRATGRGTDGTDAAAEIGAVIDAAAGTSPTAEVDPPPVTAPAWWLQLAENRVWFELGALAAASPALRAVGRGDRHPVLVLPGFSASDRATQPLRWLLRSQGFWVHGWRLGRNLGPTNRVVDALQRRLDGLHDRHGRPVSLVGWSLGGIYARELARRQPGRVRQVITLGSPFRLRDGDRSAASPLADPLMHRWRDDFVRFSEREQDKPTLTVPSTAVYSRSDGVVRWHTCIDVVDELHENVEVVSSHLGLVVNPAVAYVLVDRLNQPADDWRPFVAPLPLRRWYPRPVSWTSRTAELAAG